MDISYRCTTEAFRSAQVKRYGESCVLVKGALETKYKSVPFERTSACGTSLSSTAASKDVFSTENVQETFVLQRCNVGRGDATRGQQWKHTSLRAESLDTGVAKLPIGAMHQRTAPRLVHCLGSSVQWRYL